MGSEPLAITFTTKQTLPPTGATPGSERDTMPLPPGRMGLPRVSVAGDGVSVVAPGGN